jgi:rhodanese-related sulfurtransferase
MSMVSGVIGGVDTHADVHVAAAIDENGGLSGIESFPADAAGYEALAVWSAWLWRALRLYGHESIRILDGGFTDWVQQELPVEAGEHAVEPSQFVARPQPDLRVEIDDAVSAMSASDTGIVGGLSQPSHTGSVRLFPSLPSGHIPGAVNIPALDNLDPETGRLPPVAGLVECWEPIVDSVERVTTYCGAGMYGAFSLFVLYPTGYDAALCDGSGEEWAATKHPPVATTTAGSKDDRWLSAFAHTTGNGGTSAQMPGIVRAFSLVSWTARCSTSSSAPLSSVDPLEADRTESWFGDVALPGSSSWASA